MKKVINKVMAILGAAIFISCFVIAIVSVLKLTAQLVLAIF